MEYPSEVFSLYPKINPRQLSQAMHQMGISQEEIDAREVIIRCKDKNIIISSPSVVKVKMSGEESFQVSGKVSEERASTEPEISEDDIATVIEQAGVRRDAAESALKRAKGDLAEAILFLKK
ncbi:MAG: nascent polypeptide-associated complex protein [Candidatus Woesearchaeota archaeon]|nr:nascent polypeptide-associated complex protein [Candidatus Woesearchaeota archaeon]